MTTDEPGRVDAETPDLAAEKLAQLQELFPGAFADGVVDAARIGELVGMPVAGLKDGRERYGLMWAGKQEAVASLLTPSRGTLVPDMERSLDFENARNVFIEGDNLEVLKILQKSYNDQVKLIYIDPPYNTTNDFVYNDDFVDSLRAYLEYTGQSDAAGKRISAASETTGRKHSGWLSMMYPRLVLARNLLKRDGFIFVSIDDTEAAALKLIMDEIFGPENFVTTIMWKRKKETANDSRNVSVQGEYMHVYSRSIDGQLNPEPLDEAYLAASYKDPTESFPDGRWRPVPITVSAGLKGGGYTYEIQTPAGALHERLWAYPQASYERLLSAGRIYFGEGGAGVPQRVMYAHESSGKPTTNYWDSTASNKAGKKVILDFFGDNIFDTPKPIELLQRIIRLIPGDDFISLDFFAGSGTLAHAVASQNAIDGGKRRTVSVNLPEPTSEGSVARRMGYPNVADITYARILKVMEKVPGASEGGIRVLSLSRSAFAQIESDDGLIPLLDSTLGQNADSASVAQEVLLREGVRLDRPWATTDLGGAERFASGGVTVVTDLELTQDAIDAAIESNPRVLVFLEDAFAGKDALKASAFYACKQAGVTMKTV